MPDEPSQAKPITTEDLYGTSGGSASPEGTTPPSQATQTTEKPPLAYEETPIIESQPDLPTGEAGAEQTVTEVKKESAQPPASETASPVATMSEIPGIEKDKFRESVPTTPPPPPAPAMSPLPVASPPARPKRGGFRKLLANLVFFGILFGLGIWLSGQIRTLFAPSYYEEEPFPTPTTSLDTLPTSPLVTPTPTQAPSAWVKYQVLNGRTRQPVAGVSYELPAEVATPVCDGTSCPSQGTYLPGGTRFTVAARGQGQVLPDFRGAILTDASGREFTMRQTTIGGRSVYEYTGNFTGSTGGGYTFTQMRGVLIPVDDTLSIEFNHFAPAGVTSDFASDEVIFDKIVASLTTTTPSY